MLFLAIIIFVFILSLLVLVHELGHFLVARRNGVKVEEFGFGYPPRICGWYRSKKTGKLRFFKEKNFKKRGDVLDTVYSLNWIPFGGFVRMLGEERDSKSKESYSQKSPWIRAKIIAAGVIFNFLLAWALLTIWFWVIPKDMSNQIVVVSVNENSIARKVGIKPNDFILEINNQKIDTIEDLQKVSKDNRGKEVSITVNHFGREETKSAVLPSDTDAPLGVGLAETGSSEDLPSTPWWQAPYWAFMEIVGVIWLSINFIVGLIMTLFGQAHVSTDAVSGPVGVFALLYQVISFGPAFILRFIAMISIAVGFFNLLPFPALDGGHLLFIAGEAIRGKKIIKSEWENTLHWFGFIILLILFAVVTYNDISKWFIK